MESNKIRIDIKECLKDSPKFRMHLEEEENDVDHLEQKLERIIKLCTTSVEAGKEYVKNQSQFATSLWDLQKHFLNNKSAHNALTKIVHCMQEVNKYQTILLDQQFQICVKNLSTFLKKDIKEVKECKNLFTKVSDNLDLALNKNSQANKNRTQEVLETENFLSATRSCFHHTSIDYINHITLLQCKKQPEVLSTLLTYMQAFVTYFHQGSDLSEDYASFFKTVDDDITTMRSDYNQLAKIMQNRHSFVNEFIENQATSWSNDKTEERPGDEAGANPTPAVQDMEGYLFKRTSNTFKTWNRRWFCMKNHQLFYRKRTGDEPLPTVMEEDLRLCSVRPVVESDRRFCFAVISPTKYHILQADSDVMLQAWIRALQKGIDTAIQSGSSYNTDMCKQTERNDKNAPPSRAGAAKGKKMLV
jgi:Arf-GAP with coiled-coil, ANK repeat and PH domain-containing protein